MKFYCTLLMSLMAYLTHAQSIDTVVHTLYFDVDQATLSNQEVLDLADFLQEHLEERFSLSLIGHTDNSGPNSYNLALSQRRVEAVQQQIEKLWTGTKSLDSMAIYYQGEERPAVPNSTALAKAQNRRVELYLLRPQLYLSYEDRGMTEDFVRTMPHHGETQEMEAGDVNQVEEPKELFVKGMLILCDFKIGDSITVITTGEEAYAEGFATVTSSGVPLISAGMFVFPCGRNGANTALQDPVTVLVPVGDEVRGMPDFFDVAADGSWTTSDNTLTIVERQGKRYYLVTVKACGGYNLDWMLGRDSVEVIKTQITLARKMTAQRVNFIGNAPIYNYRLAKNRKHRMEGLVYAPPTKKEATTATTIYVEVLERGKNVVHQIPLANLAKSRKERYYPTINDKRVSWLTNIFRKTTKQLYVCYKIKARDLVQE